jgi:hypothetical protein
MKTFRETVICTLAAVAFVSAIVFAQSQGKAAAANAGLDKLKALQGEWVDVDGAFGKKGAVAVTYKVTSGGKTVIETFPINTPYEMATVYYVDGNDLVLTHYCSGGTQPRMRSHGLNGNTLTFDFDGGANIDPAVTSHMHSAQIEFLSADEIRATWSNWSHGKPDDAHKATFRIVRKK